MSFRNKYGAAATMVALLVAAGPASGADESSRKYLNDECLAREATKPSLRHDLLPSARFRRVESLDSSQVDDQGRHVDTWFRSAEETARLPGGVELTIHLAGCEDYSMTYEFRLPASRQSLSDQTYWLSQTGRLMAAVRQVTVKSEPIQWAELQSALSRASRTRSSNTSHDQTAFQWESEQGGEYGVGVMTLRIRAVHQGPADVLTVSYYVSL
jgi:hypothetical protein